MQPWRGLKGGKEQSRALIATEMIPETGLISSEGCRKDGDQHWKGQIWLRFWTWKGAEEGLGSLVPAAWFLRVSWAILRGNLKSQR